MEMEKKKKKKKTAAGREIFFIQNFFWKMKFERISQFSKGAGDGGRWVHDGVSIPHGMKKKISVAIWYRVQMVIF
jgi:hypothetical protein